MKQRHNQYKEHFTKISAFKIWKKLWEQQMENQKKALTHQEISHLFPRRPVNK